MNTNVDIKTILEKWAEFSEWDPEQKKFNLMSYNYFFHITTKNKEHVVKFLVQGYVNKLKGEKDSRFTINDDFGWGSVILNDKHSYRSPYYWDDTNEKPCNIYISFKPDDYLDIEGLIGEEVPKIIKGFSNHWGYNGNCILDTVDYVSELQTPFEARRSFSIDPYREDFKIAIGFSKSGLKKYIKDNNIV